MEDRRSKMIIKEEIAIRFFFRKVDDRINLIPQVINSGHFSTVEDCCWDKRGGRYLLSVSTDKTTRLHAEWKRNEVSERQKLVFIRNLIRVQR